MEWDRCIYPIRGRVCVLIQGAHTYWFGMAAREGRKLMDFFTTERELPALMNLHGDPRWNAFLRGTWGIGQDDKPEDQPPLARNEVNLTVEAKEPQPLSPPDYYCRRRSD